MSYNLAYFEIVDFLEYLRYKQKKFQFSKLADS